MELNASPYHRMLTVLAIQREWIKYTQIERVSVKDRGDTVAVGPEDSETDAPIVDVHLDVLEKNGTRRRSVTRENAFFIARHGYNSPIIELWPSEEIKFRRQQLLYADQDQLKPELVAKLAAAYGRADPLNGIAFYDENRSWIDAYFKSNYGLLIRLEENPRQFVVTRLPEEEQPKEKALPMRLFEIDIANRESADDPRSFNGVG